jgi:single-strand DNA-binding protein
MEIIARLTKDAEVKTLKDERQVVNFSVAINDSYKPKGASETTKVTMYVDCAYWANPALAKFLTKGTLVELYGRLGVNAYINMQGEAKASLRFHVNNIKLHGGSKSNGNVNNTDQEPVKVISGQLTEPLDDLPF